MHIRLELNQKHGYGYQVRLIHPLTESVLDAEPFTLNDAASGAAVVLETLNKELGTSYQIHEVMSITEEALEVNRKHDIGSMKVWKEIHSKKDFNDTRTRAYAIPNGRGEDGEEDYLLSACGVLLLAYSAWKDDKTEPSRIFLTEYCRMLAMRGYGAGASTIFREMDAKEIADGAQWMRDTYAQYVWDGREVMRLVELLEPRK